MGCPQDLKFINVRPISLIGHPQAPTLALDTTVLAAPRWTFGKRTASVLLTPLTPAVLMATHVARAMIAVMMTTIASRASVTRTAATCRLSAWATRTSLAREALLTALRR